MLVGWLPMGTGVPTVAVCGSMATMELPVTLDEPEPTLAMMLREYGS
jgi:hypothetical protein